MDFAGTHLPSLLTCSMTRKRQAWKGYKRAALALAHNAGVVVKAGWPRLLEPGQDNDGVILATTNKLTQLNWRLCITCGGESGKNIDFCHHIKRCTPEAIDEPKMLLCCLCADRGYYKSWGRAFPSEEVQHPFMVEADHELYHTEWVWECKCLSTWNGCIDLFLLDCELMVQVDGSQHFDGVMFDEAKVQDIKDKHVRQGRDWECNELAWKEGGAMLRLHYKDLGASGIALMLWVREQLDNNVLARPVLVLSEHFNELQVESKTHGVTSYVERLEARLDPAPVRKPAVERAILLTV